MIRCTLFIAVLGVCQTVLCSTAWAADDDTFFKDQVLPIFERRCFSCHSHTTGEMKGGLTLGWRSGWSEGGDSGPAIVPGKPDDSLLIQAVRREGLEMPPEEALSAPEIATLVDWVKRGAPDPRKSAPAASSPKNDWWCFQPIARPPVPEAANHPIDAFILAKLQEQQIAPASEADRTSLIRRLTFDLHGLPPTPEEVDAFVKDPSDDAYEKLVDRLLASPRYGERFARLWLDVVHYGESDGFGMDRPRMTAWPYRDYVIRSFNDDKPYARFVQEQLATDALFANEPSLTPALGFIAAGPFNQSALVEQVDGTLCKKIALNLDRDDMVSSVASTFLSVTVHCARCHSHKFDPISQRDYYRMQAAFAGLVRGDRPYDNDPSIAQERRRLRNLRSKVTAGTPLAELAPEDREYLIAKQRESEQALLDIERKWQPLSGMLVADVGTQKSVTLPDGSMRLEGPSANKDTYVLVAAAKQTPVAALRLEVFADEKLPHGGPGLEPTNGNFVLSELRVIAAPLDEPEKAAPVKIESVLADFEQADAQASKAFDGRPSTGWGIHPQTGRSHVAVFTFNKPLAHKNGTLLTIRLEQVHGTAHMIGRLRMSVAAATPPAWTVISPDLARLVQDSKAKRSAEAEQQLAKALALGALEKQIAALPAEEKVFAVGSDLPARKNYKPPGEPYPIHVLRRGDVTKPMEPMEPGALEAIDELSAAFKIAKPNDESLRRAALATWITDANNPLTWRSIVNRVWLWHFDRGIVDSPNDFGRMGGLPSHPELLDWLASEFRESGGSFKALHRLIVTSRTYRQSTHGAASASVPDPLAIDADNRLLWRQNRRRLDAEQLRDALLTISGKLDVTAGGPSAMQFNYSDPNPGFVPRIDYAGFDPDAPASLRRGVYRFLFRNINDPLLEAFDAVDPSLSTPRRSSVVTPLQALSLFNSKFVLRQSEHLAARLQQEADTPEKQIDRACQLLYGRAANPDEVTALTAYAARHGLANACRVLVNTNEFLFLP